MEGIIIAKVIIGKNYLKRSLVQNEESYKSISRFIDNSIKANYTNSLKSGICKISITIGDDIIIIEDNSGGISDNITEEELFKIDCNDKDGSGLGMKMSFFTLGQKIEIFSNKINGSRKFSLDTNRKIDELSSKSEKIDYNRKKEEGTKIIISNLNKEIKKEVKESNYKRVLKRNLGYTYRKFIDKGDVIIEVNEDLVESNYINGVKLCSKTIMDNYNVTLYKGNKEENPGIEIFINDYMKYSREDGKKEIEWNKLKQSKYRYRNCIVEVEYNGDILKYEENKKLFYNKLTEFIKENKHNFKSKKVTVIYEADIDRIEELKEYYNETSAKAIGEKALEKLYELYENEKNQNY